MIMDKEKNFVSAVIYVHKYTEQLSAFLEKICQEFQHHFQNYEVILVNNKAGNDIQKIAKSMVDKGVIDQINIVNMGGGAGLEASMNAGDDFAIGDFIFEFDSVDCDFDEGLIWEVYKKALEGFDLVSAVPKGRKKCLSSKMFYFLYNISKKSEYRLCSETFRVISRRAYNRVKTLSNSIPYRKALYTNCGLKQYKFEYQSCNTGAESKCQEELENKFVTATDTLVIFTDVLEWVSVGLSTLFLLFSSVVLIYTVYTYFGTDKPVEGWAPLMGALSFSFFGVFFILTAVLKYLSVILKLVFHNQNYLIESTEKITRS